MKVFENLNLSEEKLDNPYAFSISSRFHSDNKMENSSSIIKSFKSQLNNNFSDSILGKKLMICKVIPDFDSICMNSIESADNLITKIKSEIN